MGCPIYKFTGHACPSCGTTRALISLIKLDLDGYFHYNPMAMPLLSVFFSTIFGLIRKKPFMVYSLTVVIINYVLYLQRLL
ncbi:MAG: DUF2752 domain-containing protein [Clostridia bacterium]|nr:DUF2752 domain-containing protein [Clostridia bacterium]